MKKNEEIFLDLLIVFYLKKYNDITSVLKILKKRKKSLLCSLCTNIPVNKCIKNLESQPKKSNIILSLPIKKIIKVCTLCIKLINGFFV